MRMNIAALSPSSRARARWCSGSLPVSIEMKTMLSIPRTISSSVRVRKATHTSGLASRSSMGLS